MIRAERLPETALPPIVADPGILTAYLEDASGAAPGRAAGLTRPACEREVAAILRASRSHGWTLLPQAARSSLTGGAIPRGELVVSMERMREMGATARHPGGARQSIGPGVRLDELQRALDALGLYYPPVPTFRQAMIGGAVATNAGGPATFKYGVTRQWVRGLHVVLANGDRLILERGQAVAPRGGRFLIQLSDGSDVSIPAPTYRLPSLKKISAGYHSADQLDLVDLFIGSEGTLGLITEVTLELAPLPPGVLTGIAFVAGRRQAVALAAALRAAAERSRAERDSRGPDIRSIEYLDQGCLETLRRHGDPTRLRVNLPAEAGGALLFEMELERAATDAALLGALERFLERRAAAGDDPCGRLFEVLDAHDALRLLELALPEDPRRAGQLAELREAVPRRFGEALASARQKEPGLQKVGGDLIVPVGRLDEMIDAYEAGFSRRGLAYAIWGHLSDGNLHPNALPRDRAEQQRGFEALLEFAAVAKRLGGCPLSEHGVGRNPVKQEMLRRFLGEPALLEMASIKRALDPECRLAPGVLLPRLTGVDPTPAD